MLIPTPISNPVQPQLQLQQAISPRRYSGPARGGAVGGRGLGRGAAPSPVLLKSASAGPSPPAAPSHSRASVTSASAPRELLKMDEEVNKKAGAKAKKSFFGGLKKEKEKDRDRSVERKKNVSKKDSKQEAKHSLPVRHSEPSKAMAEGMIKLSLLLPLPM